jgi:hypothetical protein
MSSELTDDDALLMLLVHPAGLRLPVHEGVLQGRGDPTVNFLPERAIANKHAFIIL